MNLLITEPVTAEQRNKLTAAEYWEWRTTIAEMQHAKTRREKVEGQVEIAKLRAIIMEKTMLRDAKEIENTANKEYSRFVERLEAALGVTLKGKTISDIDFTINDLGEGSDGTGKAS